MSLPLFYGSLEQSHARHLRVCSIHHLGLLADCAAGDLEPSLGVLLADFFRLFGRSLNIEEVGISCSHGGSFYNKLDAEKEQPQKLWMLSVEDPADAANDLTKGSWNINMVSL